MPKFVIEREIPGAGNLTPAELKAISRKSRSIEQSGAECAVDSKLRHRRSDLLHLSRRRRIARAPSRRTWRLPG